MIDLSPAHLAIVERILAEHVPECEVRAFGSRATWNAKDYSDLDLAVVGDERLPRGAVARLKEAFEDSPLPMRVDVVDWHSITDGFRESIESDCVVVQEAASLDDWRDVVLGDYATLTKGLSYKSAFLNEDGPDLFGLGQFVPGGGAKLDGGRTYSGEYRDKDVARPGDVLIAMTDLTQRGDVLGSPLMIPRTVGDFCLFTLDAGKLKPHKGLEPQFLYYTLRSEDFRGFAAAHATGTTVRRVRPADVLSYEFPLPPLEEQRAIARVLGALDDKIELNRRMSETLEEMARTLFRSWFVDFDPVRAKAEGRPSGLPPDLDALFPASFEASELGEVPAGWEVKALGDLVDVARGLSYKGAGLLPDGVPMHNLNSIHEGGGYKHDGIKHYAGDHKPQHVTRAGDVIVANTEQGHDRLLIGYAAVVPDTTGDKNLFSHHLYRVRPTSRYSLPADFVCELLNTHRMHEIVSGYANGTTVNMLPADALQVPSVVVPPPPLAAWFGATAESIRIQCDRLIERSIGLVSLRDTLLPPLVSGELRIGV